MGLRYFEVVNKDMQMIIHFFLWPYLRFTHLISISVTLPALILEVIGNN
jgi:hypothetical protein